MKSGKATAVIVLAILLAVIVITGIKFLGPVGITGAATAGSCSGTPPACSGLGFGSCSEAAGHAGCSWIPFPQPSCVGTPTGCNAFTDKASCGAQQGCSWTAATYTLTTDINPSGSGSVSLSPSGGTYSDGTSVTLTATANANYVFSNWAGGTSGSTNPKAVTVNSDTSVTANFASSGGGGGGGQGNAQDECSGRSPSQCTGPCTPQNTCAVGTNYTCTYLPGMGSCNVQMPSPGAIACVCQAQGPCQNVCIQGNCNATCGADSDCANIAGANVFSCQGQTITYATGKCSNADISCSCYLQNTNGTTCGGTNETNWCSSPSSSTDCNVCDVAGDQDGNQGGWNSASADKCDQNCASHFTSLNQAHIAASSVTVNSSTYQATETSCDGIDNDCNGVIDDISGNNSISSTKCGCYNGASPSAETCNGIDDDCNGQIDGSGVCNTTDNCGTYGNKCTTTSNTSQASCVSGLCVETCVSGQTKSCYSGAAGTSGVGACHNGTQTCSSSGAWGSCAGEVIPTAEICIDGIDNNCNNLTDSASEGCGQHNQTNVFAPSVCGNSKCDANETQDNCPLDCGCPVGTELVGAACKETTEQPATCGNEIAEVGEQCDGSDSNACPGLCAPDCICPYIVGDSKCDKAAGESATTSPGDCKSSGAWIWVIIIVVVSVVVGMIGFYFYRRKSNLSTLNTAHGVSEPATGGDLGPAVNTMLSQGYSPAEISQNLTNSGWSSEDIQKAMASANQDQEQLGDIAEKMGVDVPSEEIKDAEDYAKKCLDTGFTPAQIRTALLASEWPANTVDDVLSKFTEKHVEADAKKAGVLEPTDDVDKLKDFVKKVLDEGQTPQQIKKSLTDAGWEEAKLKEVLP